MKQPRPRSWWHELIIDLFGQYIALVGGVIYFLGLVVALFFGYQWFSGVGLVIALIIFGFIAVPMSKFFKIYDN